MKLLIKSRLSLARMGKNAYPCNTAIICINNASYISFDINNERDYLLKIDRKHIKSINFEKKQ